MKTKSRILAVILTLAMTFSMLPMTAMATEVVGPPQNQQLVAGPPKGEAGPTTGDPEVVPPTVPGPTDDTTPVAPTAEPPAPPAENPGPVGPHDPGAGTRAPLDSDVAQIGDIGYATFADALDAANANDDATTITLRKDCTSTSGGTISHALTIEGGSYTLTLAPASTWAFITVNAETTINNLKITTTGINDIFHVYQPLKVTGCTLTAGTPENGIFNITETGSVKMESGTLKATGFITNGGNGLSLKTGDGSTGVDIKGGTIRLYKDAFITLLADSAVTTNTFKIQPSESLNWAQNAAAGDVLLNGSAATAHLDDIAAKITIGNEKSWDVAKSGTNLVMHQLDSIKYVHAQHTEAGDGSLANPYKTLQEAYTALPEAGGEIRVLYNMTTEAALDCTAAAKTVTITSAYRFNNISLRPGYPAANEGWTVKRGEPLKDQTAFTVSGGSVTLKNIVFDGGATWGSQGLLARTNTGIANAATTENDGQLFIVSTGGALTLDTGAVLQNNDRTSGAEAVADKGSAVYVNGGTLTINNGASILNNRVAPAGFTGTTGDGAAVSIWADGKFYMTGGTISGNTTRRMGGAIRVAVGNMYLSGGTISGNATTSASDGGGISVNAGTLHLSGAPRVNGNLQNAKDCNITYLSAKIVIADLTGVANIGVTGEAGDITDATAELGDAAFVHADDPKLSVAFESTGTKLKLVSEPHYYVKADAPAGGNGSFNAPFQYLEQAREAIGAAHGTYNVHIIGTVQGSASKYLVGGDVHATAGQLKALAGQTVNLIGESSAKILPTAGNSAVLYVGGADAKMTATDVVLQGFDQANFGNSAMGGADSAVVYVDTNGSFTMGDAASITGNYNTCNAATPTGAGAGWAGGSVYVKGTLNMATGSSITGGNGVNGYSSYSGGVVINGGTLNMTGGSISGNKGTGGAGVYVDGSGNINLSGTPVVSGNESAAGVANNIYLANERTIKLTSALTSGANIGVYVETPPVGEGTTKPVAVSGNSYVVKDTDAAYVHSDNGGDAIVQFEDGGSAGSDTSDTLVLKKLVADVYVKSDGNDAAPGTGAKEHPYKTLAKAYAEVATGGTIHVMNDLAPVTATTTFNVEKTITLESCKTDGNVWDTNTDTHTIKRNTGFADAMLDITAGEVTMKHLVLDGVGKLMDGQEGHGTDAAAITASAPLVQVYSSTKAPTLTLSDGAVLQNNSTSGSCAGIKVGSDAAKYGNLNIQTGAKIQYNKAAASSAEDNSSGCAVYMRGSYARFTMVGGEISNNTGGTFATVNIYNNWEHGSAKISGGIIKDNATTKDNGTGGVMVDDYGALTITGGNITGNTGGYGGIALWAGSHALNMGGGAAINITGNKTIGNDARNVYLQTGKTINITSPLTTGSTIGVYSQATPTPGHPVLVATGANATDATYFTSDNLVGAGIRAAKSGDTDSTGIYLDVAEKMKAKIIYAEGEKLYKTFDEAIKAITDDSTNALDDASGHYKIELLADCTTNGAFPVENITMESTSEQHYTLMVKNFITTAGGTFTANNIKFADATPQHEWLQAKSTWTFTGCELPNFAVVGVTVTLDTGTVVSGNIRIDSNTAGNLAIKAGNVPVNGTISINNATSKITLLADSTAAKRYNVQYANSVDLSGGTKIVMDGTTTADSTLATNLAKNVSIFGGNDATKEWVAIGSTNDVKVKEAKAYWVSKDGSDSSPADGTYLAPFKTIAKAYTAGAAEVGLDIRVLSDLPTTAATTFATDAITSVKISSYKGENTVADKPWTITRKDIANPLLTVTKGAVNLTDITLDGNKEAVAATAALVSVGTGTSLTLNDGATIQNNKNSTASGLGGGVAVSGTLTMNSGSTITGNTLTGDDSTYGGGVYVADGATFQMNGGTISNNTVTSPGGSGGAIMVVPGDATTATVRIGGDALITGNSCGANGAAIHGGAAGSTVAISGNAKITGNRINAAGYVGAAVYPHNGSLVLSDGVQITGNSNQNGNACNVYLGNTKTLTIAGAHMGAGSSVGVYCQTMPDAPGETVDIATNAVEADKGHFFSDKSSEAGIKFDGDKVVLAYDARYIPQPTRPDPDKPDPGVTVEPGPGKVTTWPKNPDPGTKVTITIEPETGWEIDKVIIVTVPGGEPVVITGTDPITYIAPDPNTVKITVKYKRIPVDPKISGVAKLLNCDDHIAYMVGVPGGNFDPTRGITRGETAQMFYNLLRNKDIGAVARFSDVEAAAWYADAVNALAALQIIEGRGADAFDPSANTSRAEFTAIAMRFAIATKGEVTFTDVPGDYWAESAISGAAQYGWIMGYADGSFKPQADITRAEAAKVVNTMLGRFPDKKFIDGATGLKAFPDVKKDYWAFYQIAEATNAHNFTKVKNAETWTK